MKDLNEPGGMWPTEAETVAEDLNTVLRVASENVGERNTGVGYALKLLVGVIVVMHPELRSDGDSVWTECG